MMQFRVVRDAIKTKLNEAADLGGGPRYQVVGFQRQDTASSQRKLPTVTVFYNSGDFPMDQGSIAGPNQHNTAFAVQLTIVKGSEGDLSAMDTATTEAGLAAALATFKDAAANADDLMDQLADDIYQVLMDSANETFGLPIGALASRWVGAIQKNDVVRVGQSVILTGFMRLTCRVEEKVLGVTGTSSQGIDVTTDLDGDDIEQTGAAV